LNYIRTLLVEVKTGLKNLRTIEKDKDNTMAENNSKIETSKSKKKKKTSMVEEESSDDSEKDKNKNLLTKEKILEYKRIIIWKLKILFFLYQCMVEM
jgi:hypothetical protein